MRIIIKFAELDEFKEKGFVIRTANAYVLNKLRIIYGGNLKIFKVKRSSEAKFGIYDIFGIRLYCYYDIRRKEEFVKFLVDLFYKNNPDPDQEIRKVFTNFLHLHNLHWHGCTHKG